MNFELFLFLLGVLDDEIRYVCLFTTIVKSLVCLHFAVYKIFDPVYGIINLIWCNVHMLFYSVP